MRAGKLWWRVAVTAAVIPVLGVVEFAFGRPFWLGVIQGSIVAGLLWLGTYRRAGAQAASEQQASTGSAERGGAGKPGCEG
ncbi:hypothetical protein [Krasilnikovia sp. MM14-A1259]|uniref:hypothetical protein n=1 Tax=Krasilnikovia sp. MM14-A1259 TaxID=3373539 RepID=UPI0038021293